MRRLRESGRALRDVFGNPGLRRLQLAWAGSIFGTWAYLIAVAVYAYEHGGPTAVAVVSAARWLSGAIASPFASVLADRYDHRRVMIASDVAQASLIAVAGLAVLAGVAAPLVYLIATLVAVANTAFRPAEAAVTPMLARTPAELTASNLVGSTIESLGIVGGPALGAGLLAVSGVATAFFTAAGCVLWSTGLVAGLKVPKRNRAETGDQVESGLAAGIRIIVREPRVRLVIGVFAAQSLTAGVLKVAVVVVAFRLLESGQAGVGVLNSAIGIGALVGALVVALIVVGRTHRLAWAFGLGLVVWSVPCVLVAASPGQTVVLLMFGVLGVGLTLSDVAGTTLLQRVAPEEAVGRVFGVLGTAFLLMWAVGALIAPVLIALVGVRGTLAVTGAFLLAVVAAVWPRLTAIDRSVVPPAWVELLRGVPFLALLSDVSLDRLAVACEEVSVAAGAVVFAEGDRGDRFYIVADGIVAVLLDGHGPTELGRGESFGEIALIRDIPRTATVRAQTDVQLIALDRETFISAVEGNAPSGAHVDSVIRARLEGTASVVGSA